MTHTPDTGEVRDRMAEIFVGKPREFDEEARKIVSANGREVVVFRRDDEYYAFDNYCLHAGGPVGEGILLGRVEAVVSPEKKLLRETFSDTETHLICPWHGWEYDIRDGACAGDRSRKLKKYDTVQKEDGVYVVA